MNAKNTLRRLRRRIFSLRAELDNLQQQLNERDEEMQNDERRASEKIWAISQEANREHRRLQDDARGEREEALRRQYERDIITRDLERAVDWKRLTGIDSFGDIERCMQKLRRM